MNNFWRTVFHSLLLITVLVTGITLRLNNISNVTQRSPDEEIYSAQARILSQEGNKGLRALVDIYNSHSNVWIYPPPTRIGYLWLLAGIMKATNSGSEHIGAYVSTFFSIISLLLLIVIGLRFFNKWVALVALLFMSVSPMELAIARRTWQDAMLGCIGVFLIYCCCEITRSANKIIWYVLFFILGSYCILVKESGIIIYGLCVFWILWVCLFKEKRFLKGFFLGIIAILGVSASIFLLVHSIGGLTPVLTIIKHVKEAMPTNTYAVEYQSGPWYSILEGIWLLDPVNVILCSVGILGIIFQSLISRQIVTFPSAKNKLAILGILLFMVIFMVITIMAPYCQNLRYISVLFVPFYLISGLGFCYIVFCAKSIFKNFYFYTVLACLVGMIMATSINNYRNFQKLFVKTEILDISIRLIKINL